MMPSSVLTPSASLTVQTVVVRSVVDGSVFGPSALWKKHFSTERPGVSLFPCRYTLRLRRTGDTAITVEPEEWSRPDELDKLAPRVGCPRP